MPDQDRHVHCPVHITILLVIVLPRRMTPRTLSAEQKVLRLVDTGGKIG